jgi:hypothetical protein
MRLLGFFETSQGGISLVLTYGLLSKRKPSAAETL